MRNLLFLVKHAGEKTFLAIYLPPVLVIQEIHNWTSVLVITFIEVIDQWLNSGSMDFVSESLYHELQCIVV